MVNTVCCDTDIPRRRYSHDPALRLLGVLHKNDTEQTAHGTEQLREFAEQLEGQLTATVLAADADADEARALLPVLERKVGRILFNGWPTGVEVGYSMVHGGPYPATSDARSTSVGALAIERFLRPVAYQDVPDALLPEALRDANEWGVPRMVEGRIQLPAKY